MGYFDREKQTFQENLLRWLGEHEGQWVVIHQDRILGLFRSHQEGYQAATSELDEQPFLLRQVRRTRGLASVSAC